jgi:hypothetical protein
MKNKEENQVLNEHVLQPSNVSDPTLERSSEREAARTARYILHDPISGRYHTPPVIETQATATALNLNRMNPEHPAIERIDIWTGEVRRLWRAFGRDFDEKDCWKDL